MPRYTSREPISPRIRFIVDTRRDREAKADWGHMCLMCRAPIERLKRGRRRTYCSNACRQKHHRQHQRAVHGRDFYIARRERAARSLLRQAERYRGGRVDDTPIWPGFLNTPRTAVLFDLFCGLPLDFCQWCAKPMTRRNFLGTKFRCCSTACAIKWGKYRFRLHDALIRVDNRIDPIVKFRLSLFSLYSREPQPVFRSEVRVCDHCIKPYAVKGFTSRFCSKRCRQAAWRRAHRACKVCGRRFKIRMSGGVKQVYCSTVCQSRRGRLPAPAERACPTCGETFTPSKYAAHSKKYCSRLCRVRHQQPVRIIAPRECRHCSRQFTASPRTAGRHFFCSHECGIQYRFNAQRRPVMDRICPACGTTFTPSGKQRLTQIYCTVQCRTRARNWRHRGIPLPETLVKKPILASQK